MTNYSQLYETFGSIREAAAACGLSRMTFWRRLQKERIDAATPEGMAPVQVTTDGEGKPTAIKSRVKPGAVFTPREGHEVYGDSALLNSRGEVTAKWVKTRKRSVSVEELIEACTAVSSKWRPSLRVPPPPSLGSGTGAELLNVFAYGDPHIGMLSHARETGQNFDLKICTRDLVNSSELLLARAPQADNALLFISGDLWHSQDDKQRTPKGGNSLDQDGRTAKILETGLAALERMISRILSQHRNVTIASIAGNHDPNLSLVTAIWLKAIYRNTPRVTVLDNANPYVPFSFGENFFLMTHGDNKVKPQELGEIMLADFPQLASVRHRRAFTGHIHHKNVQEFRWGFWESFNSLCARDFWHHHSGYRSSRLVEGITFHADFGYRSRFVVSKEELDRVV